MTHSLVLLLLLLGAAPLAESIPTALLAGILIKVGLDIIDWGFLRRAHRLVHENSAGDVGALLMTVFWDLIGEGLWLACLRPTCYDRIDHRPRWAMRTPAHLSTHEQLLSAVAMTILFRMDLEFLGAAITVDELVRGAEFCWTSPMCLTSA